MAFSKVNFFSGTRFPEIQAKMIFEIEKVILFTQNNFTLNISGKKRRNLRVEKHLRLTKLILKKCVFAARKNLHFLEKLNFTFLTRDTRYQAYKIPERFKWQNLEF